MARLAFLTEVRDGEAYLPQAIESILHQTFSDFIYYITDDGSSDGTRDIITAFAAKDPRIIADYRENDMVGNFRHTLQRIYESGAEYFALLDCDDWYEPEFAETMISLMESTNADLAEAKFIAHYEDGSGEDKLPGFGDTVITLEQFAENFAFYSHFEFVQQWWGKVYKVAKLRQMRLLPDLGWDTEFVLRYRAGCSVFAVCDQALHHYRIRESSDCHKRISSFPGGKIARALALQHAAREALLDAAGCQNPQSRLMASYQDVNGVKSNMMRLYTGNVPDAVVAEELPHLLRLPFLAEAYETLEHAYEESGVLFFAQPKASEEAMKSIRSYYGFFLRLLYRYGEAREKELLFGWLCRVFPHLGAFFELEDLDLLMNDDEAAIAILEHRYRQALAGLRDVGPEEERAPLRAFACARLRPGDRFLRQFADVRGEGLSPKKRAFLGLQTSG